MKHFVSVFSKLQTSKSKLFTISVSDLLEINCVHKIEFLMFSGGRECIGNKWVKVLLLNGDF